MSCTPRTARRSLVAGAGFSDDVLKCQPKPIDHKVAFTAEESQQLRQAFPGGVCDDTKSGVNRKPLAGTYLRLPLSAPPSRSTSASR